MKAIGYIRLSRKDQSKYSLAGQESAIKSYCMKYDLQLLSIFTDNGQCSDTFERTNFKVMEQFLQRNKGTVQYLIVMDHDRFSRDLSKALAKIEALKRKYGVQVLSTDEPINLDTSDPQIFIGRTLKYAMANLELLNIRKRLKNGIRNAMESGRFVQKAPFGYQNSQDISGKSTLSIKELEASIIRKIFQDYLAGTPLHRIYEVVRKAGFPNRGHGAIKRVLQNCVYAGLIRIHSTYVRALHEPIIKEDDFWLVQSMIKEGVNHRTQPREDFPLRGILSCSCGVNMTAGWSKGKTKHYIYYRCMKHANINLPGSVLHEKFIRLLHHLTFTSEQLDYLKAQSATILKRSLNINSKQLAEQKQLEQEIVANIEKLEERFIREEITQEMFRKWESKFDSGKATVKRRILQLVHDRQNRKKVLFQFLTYLTSAWDVYEKAGWENKFTLIKKIFPDGITFSADTFYTTKLNEVFLHNKAQLENKCLLLFSTPK